MIDFIDDLFVGAWIISGIIVIILIAYLMAVYAPYLLVICVVTPVLWGIGRTAKEIWRDMAR